MSDESRYEGGDGGGGEDADQTRHLCARARARSLAIECRDGGARATAHKRANKHGNALSRRRRHRRRLSYQFSGGDRAAAADAHRLAVFA